MSPSRAELEREDVVGTLETLKAEGKLRFIGMSGILPDLRDHLAMGVFDAFQIPYSGLEREHEAIIREAAAAGAGTIIRGGVARGAPAPDQDPDRMPEFWRGAMRAKRDRWARARIAPSAALCRDGSICRSLRMSDPVPGRPSTS